MREDLDQEHSSRRYGHLGVFSDWVAYARNLRSRELAATPEADVRARVREALGFFGGEEAPVEARIERRFERGGISGEEVSWSVGYGPRTRAWLLKPLGAGGPLPGVLALHCHGGSMFYGKETIADGPDETPPAVTARRDAHYGGRAFANELAREGFVVLVHDAFLWGSRGFPLDDMPDTTLRLAEAETALGKPDGVPEEVALYDAAARHHEHLVEKYCRLLATTLAGVVAREDRIAASYLLSRPDVSEDGVGCVGLSGGGCRSALLQATREDVFAAVVVGMMSTYDGLLDGHVSGHTWMIFPDGWARHGDWPDLAACGAPSPLLVQYTRGDHLFTPEGMRAAHERIAHLYAESGHPGAYDGRFYDGPHRFDGRMQREAFAWLQDRLGPP